MRNLALPYSLTEIAAAFQIPTTFGGRRRTIKTGGKFYDTVRPSVRKAWKCAPGDLEGRAKALSRD